MELKKAEDTNTEKVEIPNVIGITLEEAKKILLESGLDVNAIQEEVLEENEENPVIKEQIPVSGVSVLKETRVIIKY